MYNNFSNSFISLPEITKNLIIINGIVFLACIVIPGLQIKLSLFYFTNPEFRPYQIITHMFNHAGLAHLFFNMFTLYSFGGFIERYLGAKKFLLFYLLTGLGGALLHIGVDMFNIYQITGGLILNEQIALQHQQLIPIYITRMLGASGAVFGVLTAFGTMYPEARLMLLFPPIPIKAKVLIPILIVVELFLGFENWDNIAHFAHLGGALFGYLLIKYWKEKPFY